MLAYLALVHESPAQVARLANALDDPRARLFVHVDDKVDHAQFEYMLRGRPNVHFVRPRHVIAWGGWKMVEAELTLLRAALAAGAQHMVLVSGEDYPAWSNERLIKHFLEGECAYIEHYRIPTPYWDHKGVNRIRQYWLSDDPIPLRSRLWRRTIGRLWAVLWHRVVRYGTNLLLKLGYEMGLKRRAPEGVDFHIGSQWWSMPRVCAEYVLEFVDRNPDFVRFYRHTHVPDESFFQTVLMNSPHRDCLVNDSLRYVEWDGGTSPRIMEEGDLPAIRSSDAAFVRKVNVSGRKDRRTGRIQSSSAVVRALDEARAEDAPET